ncbi:hypothetical protein ACYSNR_12815 [Enterococcus sp. LJL128]|uniref:hypothetical protein n=1 Tax=Enterococcus sp. LJL51 TaxID=3416656 RepID=UPI003CF3CCD8
MDSEQLLKKELQEIEEERYQAEKLESEVLSEEEYFFEDMTQRVHSVYESQEQWGQDPMMGYLFEEQADLLRQVQQNRQDFMDTWVTEMKTYKQKLSDQEDHCTEKLYKERQGEIKEEN